MTPFLAAALDLLQDTDPNFWVPTSTFRLQFDTIIWLPTSTILEDIVASYVCKPRHFACTQAPFVCGSLEILEDIESYFGDTLGNSSAHCRNFLAANLDISRGH
jgi:hypothetical protein